MNASQRSFDHNIDEIVIVVSSCIAIDIDYSFVDPANQELKLYGSLVIYLYKILRAVVVSVWRLIKF